jgi:RNA polymerase sigma factor (sigma-70 family)
MDEGKRKTIARRFEMVIRPHFEALYRAAMRLTRSREDAEDLVQEVVLRALPEIGHLETLESPRGWLLRVQYRIFVDSIRRRARSPLVDACSAVESGEPASGDPGPEDLTEALLARRRLARVWDALDRKQRALLALHAEGYTLAELEEITGLSRNTLGVRLHRARARLAKLIRSESAGELRLVGMEG